MISGLNQRGAVRVESALTNMSSQGNPFVSVSGGGIMFVGESVMAPVVADYHTDKRRYRNHLPLVVGRVGQAAMQAIENLYSYSEHFPAFTDLNMPGGIAANNEACSWYVQRNFQSEFSGERAAGDIRSLALVTSALVCDMAEFSQRFFGAASKTNLRFEHGVISRREGHHLKEGAAVWHRDNQKDMVADYWLEFLLRTRFPAHYASNRHTASIEGRYTDTATLRRAGSVTSRPADGEIVLVAAGPEGTFHRAHRPAAVEAAQPSMLLRLIQMP